ncbi:hypothetical protein GCM10022296_09420 [Secundilactobacillus similis DSM 23365 = JCM 2765]
MAKLMIPKIYTCVRFSHSGTTITENDGRWYRTKSAAQERCDALNFLYQCNEYAVVVADNWQLANQ